MTPREDMTVRIAAHLSRLPAESLYGALQDLVLAAQAQWPEPMTDELRDAIATAKAVLAEFAKGVQ